MNNNEGKVSIIITTYKRPVNILRRAINSALNQTYKNIEIIVVNDCPEDKILNNEILNMIDTLNKNIIKYIILDKNSGACHARNIGIKNSRGEYIALLDDDDEWLPSKIEKQIKGFTNNDVGMVYSPYYNVEVENNRKQFISLGRDSGDLFEKLLWRNCLGGCSMPIMKKEVFDKCGMFDERFLASQDYDMWIRIAREYKIVCVDEPLTIRYLQKDSISKDLSKKNQGFELFINKYREEYLKNKEALNYRFIRKASKLFEYGYIKEGFKLYWKAIKVKVFSKYNIIEPLKGVIKNVKRRFNKS